MKNGLHIDEFNTKSWYLNGAFHRTDGPAVEWANGTKSWYLNGECHRTNGPAVEHVNGVKEWWFNGKFLGYDDKGFWSLWECLTPQQQNNLNLHMWGARYYNGCEGAYEEL